MVLWVFVCLALAAGVVTSVRFANRARKGSGTKAAIRGIVGVLTTVLGVGTVLLLQYLFATGPRDQYSTWFMYRTAYWPGWVLLYSPLIVFGLSCSASWLAGSRFHSLAIGLLALLTTLGVQLSIWLRLGIPGYILIQASAAILLTASVVALSSQQRERESDA